VFYLQGTYYDVMKRLLGIRLVRIMAHSELFVFTNEITTTQVSAIPEDPHSRPPSYSLLGVLILIRLLHRLITSLRATPQPLAPASDDKMRPNAPSDSSDEPHIDTRSVSSLLNVPDPESSPALPAEDDELTVLDISQVPEEIRAGRSCTLCLEERTASCVTECGHMFCWSCIYGWGREKVCVAA